MFLLSVMFAVLLFHYSNANDMLTATQQEILCTSVVPEATPSKINEQMNIDMCENFCSSQGYSYLYLNGDKCICGNDYTRQNKYYYSECSNTCPGDHLQYCGNGGNIFSVYTAIPYGEMVKCKHKRVTKKAIRKHIAWDTTNVCETTATSTGNVIDQIVLRMKIGKKCSCEKDVSFFVVELNKIKVNGSCSGVFFVVFGPPPSKSDISHE